MADNNYETKLIVHINHKIKNEKKTFFSGESSHDATARRVHHHDCVGNECYPSDKY